MNPDQGQTPETWQQPAETPSEYHAVNQSAQPELAAQPDPAFQETPSVAPEQPAEVQPVEASNEPAATDMQSDDEILQWQAAEGVDRNRPALWYVILALVVLALIALAIFVVKSYTFAVLIPVMALALIVYIRRPARLINYTLSRSGVHIGDRLVNYTTFRAFSVIQHEGINMLNLIPKKRFSLSEVLYFPDEIGEVLVDAVAARLPMREAKPDLLDRIVAKLRL